MSRSKRIAVPDHSPTIETVTFAMVPQGPPISASEVEETEENALEVRVLWEQTMLATRLLQGKATAVIGDHRDSIAFIPAALLGGAAALSVASATADGFVVHLPARAFARVHRGNTTDTVEGPGEVVTSRGDTITMALGNFHLQMIHGHAARALPPTSMRERLRQGAGSQVLGAALLHAAFFGVFAYYTPALASEQSSSAREDQITLMRHYLQATATPEPPETRSSDPGGEGSAASGGARASGAEGSMGKPGAARANLRWGKEGPTKNPDASLDRERALADARTFGAIGILSANSGDANAPIAVWGRADALFADPRSALGAMWGADIGEAAGSGGLGLSGHEEGGGGHGEGVGMNMNEFGKLGHDFGPPGGGGGIGGRGNCKGCTLRGHTTKGPILRTAGDLELNGRIPAEVIQRVVRSNFGRFRNCYENGLRDNPSLSGRVVTRFAVDQRGAVSMAADGGSSLPSASVVQCVVRSFYSLSFPEHQGGVVTVVYPLSLQPE
ncbi:MAG TPA: AgmX/PglI C-terminal domain-containing protein [Polyangiaceae bacterium]|nr:AgmX/PglI C-terminal domain-containing protein [Polyangiaceae bacterium]